MDKGSPQGNHTVSEREMSTTNQKEYIQTIIVGRLSTDAEKRHEALREIIALSHQDMTEKSIADLAAAIPELPMELYEKWAGLFADKILDTVEPNHIAELCKPTEDNQSTLVLLFAMFMESERMEHQKTLDIAEYNQKNSAQ